MESAEPIKLRMINWWWGRYVLEGQRLDGERVTRKTEGFELYEESLHGVDAGKKYMDGYEQHKYLGIPRVNCIYCHTTMRDLSHGVSNGRNYICDRCGAHFYSIMRSFSKNEYTLPKWFTKAEWEMYVNDI